MPCPVSFKKPGIFLEKPANRVRRETLSPSIYPSETTGKRTVPRLFFCPLGFSDYGTINPHSSARKPLRTYKTIAVQEKPELFITEQGHSFAQRTAGTPAPLEPQEPFPSAPRTLISCFAGFPYAVIGVQDALAQTDKMRRSLHQFIRFNVLNGTFQRKNDGRGKLDAVSLRG